MKEQQKDKSSDLGISLGKGLWSQLQSNSYIHYGSTGKYDELVASLEIFRGFNINKDLYSKLSLLKNKGIVSQDLVDEYSIIIKRGSVKEIEEVKEFLKLYEQEF